MSDAFTEFTPGRYDARAVETQGYGEVKYGPSDDKLIVNFYRKSVFNQAKSRQEGKRIYENHDYVTVFTPGESNLTKIDRPATELEKRRWPRQWAQYVEGKKQVPDGIPIALLFPDQPNISDMLSGYQIHTVEQLANLSAQGISTVGMGCTEWVTKAKRYIEQENKGVDHHKFEAAIKEKDAEIAAVRRQLADLTALVRSRTAPQPAVYDEQTSLINNTREPELVSHSVSFTNDIEVPDLSNEVLTDQPRRRGRPPGSGKKDAA